MSTAQVDHLNLPRHFKSYFKSYLKFHFNTDGRTDGLTKKLLAAVTQLTVCDAHARTADPSTNRPTTATGRQR